MLINANLENSWSDVKSNLQTKKLKRIRALTYNIMVNEHYRVYYIL